MATAKNKGGRPPFRPDDGQRKLVTALIGYGAPHDYVAKEVGCARLTLEKHFAEEIAMASDQANAKVVEALFKQCMAGHVTAQIWWTKARLRWSEVSTHEHGMMAGQGKGKVSFIMELHSDD